MAEVFISIGSNIEPEQNVREALRRLREVVQVRAISTIYRTAPLGRPEQPDFYNGVLEVETELPLPDLRLALREIEAQLGRVRNHDKYAPRTIDLDVIVYGEHVDHEIADRPFLSVPLYELAPNLVLHALGSVKEIAARHANHDMTPLRDYTASLMPKR